MAECLSGTSWLCARALLGVALALEWRPGYPFLLLPGPGGPGAADGTRKNLVQSLLLSFNLALELSF